MSDEADHLIEQAEMVDRERTVDVVHREYVIALEATLSEAYTIIEAEISRSGGRWHGNERKMRLLERIENLLHK